MYNADNQGELPLTISGLSHTYGEQTVFEAINLKVRPGEFMAVLGASGCGKSTLLRAIAGLVTPQKGTIRLAGKTVVRDGRECVPVEQRGVGLVFQDYALFPYQTVRENIGFGLSGSAQQKKQRVDELLTLIGMVDLADRRPAQLSGGQQQRVALARALAPKPKLLLLDEPFANVDATLRQTLGEELQMLVRSQHASVLLVTHDRAEALALADRVAIFDPCSHSARITQCDTPKQIYQQPTSRCVAELAGPAFLLPANAQGSTAQTAFGEVALLKPAQGDVTLVIRPEMTAFEADPNGEMKIMARCFQGRCYRLLCHTPQGNIFAEAHHDQTPPEIGTRGRVVIKKPCWVLPSNTEASSHATHTQADFTEQRVAV